jgi:hypothetical protein
LKPLLISNETIPIDVVQILGQNDHAMVLSQRIRVAAQLNISGKLFLWM